MIAKKSHRCIQNKEFVLKMKMLTTWISLWEQFENQEKETLPHRDDNNKWLHQPGSE